MSSDLYGPLVLMFSSGLRYEYDHDTNHARAVIRPRGPVGFGELASAARGRECREEGRYLDFNVYVRPEDTVLLLTARRQSQRVYAEQYEGVDPSKVSRD